MKWTRGIIFIEKTALLNGFDVDKFEYLTGRITVLLVNEILSVELY